MPEDPLHAENTLAWLIHLKPDADEALRLAALGHDIERAIQTRRARKDRFSTFQEYKQAHAENSARIIRSILEECGMGKRLTERICRFVRLHETGGDESSNILRNADSLSYFQNNLPLYFDRNGWSETKKRSMWGYARLSPEHRHIVAQFRFHSQDLNALLQEVVNEGNEIPGV